MFFRTLSRTPETATPPATATDSRPSAPARIPAVSVHETPEALVLLAQIPGVAAEDAQIAVDQGVLTLRGSVKQTIPAGYAPLYREYANADFARSFTLPPEIDAERISAQASNGVLRIELPKVRAAQPRRIAVKAG
jgi:HSP20 family protein